MQDMCSPLVYSWVYYLLNCTPYLQLIEMMNHTTFYLFSNPDEALFQLLGLVGIIICTKIHFYFVSLIEF